VGKIRATTLLLFAWTMIGADKCTGWGWGPDNGSGAVNANASSGAGGSASSLPWCLYDPPVGCSVYCYGVNMAGFSKQCADISASAQTDAFEMAAQIFIDEAAMANIPVCTADRFGQYRTPCSFGITPQPNPPECPSICMSPNSNCANWPPPL
jgi:hypothetical protein